MKRWIPLVLAMAILGLAACGGTPSTSRAAGAPTPKIATQKVPVFTAATTEKPTALPTATTVSTSGVMPGCTISSVRPTPGPTEQSLFPPVTENDWVRGPITASVTILEYSDFQ